MKVNIHLHDGTFIEEDVDFSSMTAEELKPYAELGISEALSSLKKLIGYDYLKPSSSVGIQDIEYYKEWLKKNDPEKYAEIKAEAAKIDSAEGNA